MSKVYETLGIKEADLLEMQRWLFPKLCDNKTNSISDLILAINKKYKHGVLRDYALYMLGYHIGGARVCQKYKMSYVIDPETL